MEENKTYINKIRAALNCSPEEFAKKYSEYKKAEAEFKKVFEPFKTYLLELHQSGEELPNTIVLNGVKLSYVSPSVRTSIDSKKLQEEEPEIAKKFTKTTEVAPTIKVSGDVSEQ